MTEVLTKFVENLSDWRAYLGFVGTGCYAARVIVQWLATEKEKRIVVPVAFWYLSLGGALFSLVYGFLIYQVPIILQNLPNMFFYTRNLMIHRAHLKSEEASV